VATLEMGSRNANRYFPGVESIADAELLDVKAGNEIDRIDLSLADASDHTPTIAVGNGVVFITTSPLRPAGPDEPVAVVRGRVVSATGGVVSGAQVRLTQNAGGAAAVTRSGRDGRFAFTGIVPGPFLIAASKTGYSSNGSPFGRALTVTATGADAELTLTPWSTVTGRVVDESGEPVQGASLQLLRPQFQDGRRRLVPAATRTSDDRGVFRIFGVEPGRVGCRARCAGTAWAGGKPQLDPEPIIVLVGHAGWCARG
jgi:hypothetical protein